MTADDSKPVHPVALSGSGYVCLATKAIYYVSMDSYLKPETTARIFAHWDKEHKATHRFATEDEVKEYNRINR